MSVALFVAVAMRPDSKLARTPARPQAGLKDGRGKVSSKDQYATRPISELDLTGCERATQSVVRLPANYPKLACSGRTDIGKEVRVCASIALRMTV